MNDHPLQQSSDSSGSLNFQSPQMAHNSNNDLQFTTSVDTSVRQNVPIPAIVPPSQVPMASSTHRPTNLSGGEAGDSVLSGIYKSSAHPVPCIFHFLFKTLALLVYIFSGTNHFIITTVTCIVFLSMDFWVVKNVTGRLLVGLRWWSQNVGDDGTDQKWIFESHEGSDDKPVNKFDNTVFWTVIYLTPAIWGTLFFVGLLKLNLKWLITVFFGIALSAANTYGYYQCSQDQKAKWQRMMVKGAEFGAISAIRNSATLGKVGSFASRIVGFGTSASSAAPTAASTSGTYANVNPGHNHQMQPQYGQPLQHV